MSSTTAWRKIEFYTAKTVTKSGSLFFVGKVTLDRNLVYFFLRNLLKHPRLHCKTRMMWVPIASGDPESAPVTSGSPPELPAANSATSWWAAPLFSITTVSYSPPSPKLLSGFLLTHNTWQNWLILLAPSTALHYTSVITKNPFRKSRFCSSPVLRIVQRYRPATTNATIIPRFRALLRITADVQSGWKKRRSRLRLSPHKNVWENFPLCWTTQTLGKHFKILFCWNKIRFCGKLLDKFWTGQRRRRNGKKWWFFLTASWNYMEKKDADATWRIKWSVFLIPSKTGPSLSVAKLFFLPQSTGWGK